MFVDASAIVAIISKEPASELLAEKLTASHDFIVSPMALWEATIALAREGRGFTFDEAERHVLKFVDRLSAKIIPITPEIGTLAVGASRRFGRGRHKAELNFGDCFAYACARSRDVPLLYKGEDFVHTDIDAA